MLLHDRNNAFERIRGCQVTVQHRRELAVGLADTDLETALRDARHLEAAQLSGDVIVLDDDLQTGLLEKETKLGRVVRRNAVREAAPGRSRATQCHGATTPSVDC